VEQIESIRTLVTSFEELSDCNTRLLSLGVPLVFVSIVKSRKNHVREMAEVLLAHPAFARIKTLIFLEATMDVSDVADAVWRFANNVDPRRDHIDIAAKHEGEVNHVAFDGTRKTLAFDGFERDWPNILASDPATIDAVDALWPSLGLGQMIESPSRKYARQLYSGGAVAGD
jgi:4-hydroxy-3-polyprenylbenzoate decarboxylase